MFKLREILFILSLSSLVACDGTGISQETLLTTADAKIGGIWVGTSTNDLNPGVVNTIVAVSTDSGRLHVISSSGDQLVGQVSANVEQLTGSITSYAPGGFVYANGLPTTDGILSANVQGHDSMVGVWVADTGETGAFTAGHDPLHDIGSSLATVQGTWTAFDEFGVPFGSITVADNGHIDGQDSLGCVYSGEVGIVDESFNVYAVNENIAECGDLNGSYAGLGFFDPADNSFTYQVANGLIIITSVIFK